MLISSIFPSRYIQGRGAILCLQEESAILGNNPMVIISRSANKLFGDIVRMNLSAGGSFSFELFGGECSLTEINKLVTKAKQDKNNVIIGIGGGKSLDTAKAVAYELKKPVISVPSLASTDAPCSALAVIYNEDGSFHKYLVLPQNPNVVIVDSEIIAQAPVRFLVSGMGDALATWFEAESCKIKNATNMTGKVGTMSAYALAKLCYETLLEYGYIALKSCEAKVLTPALETIIEANTLLSGIGFESGGLGASHAIHNGLTILEDTHSYYHGEKVTFGVLASLFITKKPKEKINEVYHFCESIGLPTTLEGIGLKAVADDRLMEVAKAACAEGETIYNEPCEINPEIVFAALKTANLYGKSRMKLV